MRYWEELSSLIEYLEVWSSYRVLPGLKASRKPDGVWESSRRVQESLCSLEGALLQHHLLLSS